MHIAFSRTPGINETRQNPAILWITRFLNITLLHRLAHINTNDNLCSPSQKRQQYALCYHAYFKSTGLLTSFPFPNIRITKSVRIDLPLTDLHCQGTLALSVTANLTLLCSYSYQDLHCKRIHVFSRTRFFSTNTPAYRTHF
jgi:hypothetical protein